MVCIVCQNMLTHQEGMYAKGTLDLRYDHHRTARTFCQAVQQNCYICRALYVSLLACSGTVASRPRLDSGVAKSHDPDERRFLSDLIHQRLNSKASLFLQELDCTYRLEIQLEMDHIKIQHEFSLENRQRSYTRPDQRSVHVKYRSPRENAAIPHDRREPERHQNFSIVHEWLKMCKCYPTQPQPFYPTRLLCLEAVKSSITNNPTLRHQSSRVTIKLVETAGWSNSQHRRGAGGMHYVTLSHCWGGMVSHRLLLENYERYKRGISVQDLPKTFQDSVYFAASLAGVGYVWIDSLCIIQENESDWLRESVRMHHVYSNSFLNISATAALNSHGGLFRSRDFELLQEADVSLSIEGLPLSYDRKAVPRGPQERSRFFTRPCMIVDTSFWENQVDRGPVNTRGWVLQERLMSPRVVHFCHDQVGWECACRDVSGAIVAKGRQAFDPANEHSRYNGIIESIRQRLLDTQPGADSKVPTARSPFELWAAVVNVYTKTEVSFSRDKLIALSGVANMISSETKCGYIAGLWERNLADQLLWHIEPAFDNRDRSFSNPATFDDKCYAPSFSWAAINATGHGITFAKALNQRLFVTIQDTQVDTLTGDEFGVVSSARITLHGKLRKARLVSAPNNRFVWHLVGRGDLDDEPHRNTYLDCPLRDIEYIDRTDSPVYVLPVAEEITNSGTTKNVYLVCLILRVGEATGTYKRVGITKLSQNMDRKALAKSESAGRREDYKILSKSPGEVMLPHAGYDDKNGLHRLHLI